MTARQPAELNRVKSAPNDNFDVARRTSFLAVAPVKSSGNGYGSKAVFRGMDADAARAESVIGASRTS